MNYIPKGINYLIAMEIIFKIFLNELSNKNPTEFKIVGLDNGRLHKGKTLIIPHNIKLVFLPPDSPELYPAELF